MRGGRPAREASSPGGESARAARRVGSRRQFRLPTQWGGRRAQRAGWGGASPLYRRLGVLTVRRVVRKAGRTPALLRPFDLPAPFDLLAVAGSDAVFTVTGLAAPPRAGVRASRSTWSIDST